MPEKYKFINKNKLTKKHVHIINTHGIGDIIMMIPLIKAIYEKGPNKITITLKGKSESQILDLFLPQCSLSFIFIEKHKIYNTPIIQFFSYIKELRSLKPDIFFSAFGMHKELSSIVSFFSGAKFKIGWKNKLDFFYNLSIQQLPEKHKIYQHLHLIDSIYFMKHKPDKNIFIPDPAILKEIKVLLNINDNNEKEKIIIISPGGGPVELHKRWPYEKYANLIVKLINLKNVKIIITGSKMEIDLEKKILSSIKMNKNNKIISLFGSLSIKELVHVIYLSDLVICNCNGISHISAFLNKKIIGIYGPTDPLFTGAFSKNLSVISTNIKCSPCYKRGFIMGCKRPKCMKQISELSVFNEVLKKICF